MLTVRQCSAAGPLRFARDEETNPPPPLDVFLDWLYGEFLHSDVDKAERIKRLDGPYRLYEWQFHTIVGRLSQLFERLALIVRAAHESASRAGCPRKTGGGAGA